tara:strand:+ start:4047 stop:5015 length:969 start_codon:yes stop_codon:yes gene_type:complete
MSAREAYRAGSSGGSRVNTGTTNRERVAFNNGRQSSKEFRRANGPNKQRINNLQRGRQFNNRGLRWDEKVGQGIRELGGDVGTMGKDGFNYGKKGISSIYEAAMRGLGYGVENQNRARENEKVLGRDLLNNMRESVMTDSDIAFEKKYLKLANMAQDNEKRDEYLKVANSARRNAQISDRINFGLSNMGMTKEPFAGYESYQKDFKGFGDEGEARFSQNRFDEGLQGSAIGKAFMAEANKAQNKEAEEKNNSLIGNKLVDYNKFAGPTEMFDPNNIENGRWSENFSDPRLTEGDMNTLDPFLNPDIPFYKQRRPYYLHDYGF